MTVYESCLKVLDAREERSEQVLTEALTATHEAEQAIFLIFKRTEKAKDQDKAKAKAKTEFLDGAWDATGPLLDVRKALTRINVIKRTSFTLDGYTLVDGILLAVLTLLALTD